MKRTKPHGCSPGDGCTAGFIPPEALENLHIFSAGSRPRGRTYANRGWIIFRQQRQEALKRWNQYALDWTVSATDSFVTFEMFIFRKERSEAETKNKLSRFGWCREELRRTRRLPCRLDDYAPLPLVGTGWHFHSLTLVTFLPISLFSFFKFF